MGRTQVSSTIIVEVTSGKRAGFRITGSSGSTITIGRDSTNQIVLNDRGVSRRHCQLIYRDHQWYLEDLGSTNGIRQLRENSICNSTLHRVLSNDEFEIGTVRLRVEFFNPSAELESTELLEPDAAAGCTATLPNANLEPPCHPMRAGSTLASADDVHQTVPPDVEMPGFFAVQSLKWQSSERSLPFHFRGYQVLEKIGQGGMGDVYLATLENHKRISPKFAIKFLRQQNQLRALDRARFIREMEISANLDHPSIVRCVDCGQEKGQPFIVMPYCCGGNLADFLKRKGAIKLRRALRLLDRLLAGLEVAHNSGIVHRDLKPPNVLLAKARTGKYIPQISDFGLAKSFLLAGSSGMTSEGTVGGSWGYMPREQLTNFKFVSPQSDVWSLGAIIYECLTLSLPRPMVPKSDPIRVILESKLVPIQELSPDLPTKVAEFIMKSLSVEIVDRFKDASHMRSDLHVTARHEGVQL